MGLLRLAALALGLVLPASAQRIAAPQVRVAPVPFVVPVAPAALHTPALSQALALPKPVLPQASLMSAPSLPAAPVPEARAAAAPGPGPGGGPAAAAATTPKTVKLIMMGPPGSGKTTYGKRLSAEYGAVHISVGDLLRAYAVAHPEVAARMQTGELVDSALVLGLVRERLTRPDVAEKGYILDGFPRRLNEALAMEEWMAGVGVDAVVHLEVSHEELMRRISSRGRADDTPETFKNRMKVYREQTMPVLERFRNSTGVLEPDVSGSDPETNYARLRSILEKALKN
ncbi:hypothetical protein EPO15_01830 [bacterium]|nr:MAG: hypothetical protein EPO15_01830 [bacterium]